jgi:hypothetical protein
VISVHAQAGDLVSFAQPDTIYGFSVCETLLIACNIFMLVLFLDPTYISPRESASDQNSVTDGASFFIYLYPCSY